MGDAMSQQGHLHPREEFAKSDSRPSIWARALTLHPCPALVAGCHGWLGFALLPRQHRR